MGHILLIVGLFIVGDFVTGLFKALYKRKFISSVMRKGAWHKAGELCLVALGVLIDYAQKFLMLGFTVNVTVPICVYLCIMETGSIIENIHAINPALLPKKLNAILGKEGKEDEKENH